VSERSEAAEDFFMSKSKKTTFLILALLLVSITTVVAVLRAQNKDVQSPAKEKAKEQLSKWPVVDYDAPEPSDPEQKLKRRAKSKSYNTRNGVKFDPAYPLNRGALNNEWEFGLESVTPVAQSTAIIIGEVIGAQAYLSEDKTNIYSEFTVRVEQVLKNDNAEPMNVGKLIVAERQGGRVRFPSGRIENERVAGQNPPQVGVRYIFFLGFNPYEAGTKRLTGPRGAMSRHILTAYEIRESRIYPLDFATGKNFQEQQGKDTTTFINEIRDAVASASRPAPE
jgi:hypothetical protein